MQYGHVGPDSSNNMLAATPWIAAGALDYTAFANVITLEQAQNSMHSMNRAQIVTGDMHVFLGVQERRMQHILDDVQAEYINLSASRSRINDTDMAAEIAEFTKSQIVQQSATATIAQANTSTSIVLDLLNGSVLS
jgi:flagellin